MENQHDSKEILRSLNFGDEIRHERTETSSVTTGWGVDWDEMLIARDIMQSFYDANRKRLCDIRVEEKDGVVSIWAPEAFNLERLFCLGSEKGAGDIGHYGEGFKVAATCLLRDHGVTPVAWSGNQVLVMRISNGTVADTRLRPLVYDSFASEEAITGTMLILPGCSRKLTTKIQQGLNHFFYNENPLIGKKLWSSWDNRFAIYASGDTMGHVFYRNLKRGEMEGIPIVLVINKEYKAIENKISKDRDRNAFGGELMKLFYQTFARSGLDSRSEAIQVILEAAKPCWESGHGLLSAIASTAGYRSTLLPERTTRGIFGDKYFSRSRSHSGLEHLRYEEVEEKWEREGRIALPGYFTAFGIISAEQHLDTIEKKAKSESMAQNSRGLTPAEMASIRVLKQIVQNICPGISNHSVTRGIS
jgi:hypothetical protein